MPWREVDEPTDEDVSAFNREYRGKARFLVDESAGIGVANLLKSEGYNTKFVDELGLRGRSDEEVFASAWREQRVVITHDVDFLDNRRFPPHRNPGVILIRPGGDGRDEEGLIRCLVRSLLFARQNAGWFRGKKLDFTSGDNLTISSQGTRNRYLWREHGNPFIWEE